MSLQGNLRDFSVSEILQLLGLQTKTGCLVLESKEGQARFYVLDGRIVSARGPTLGPGDALLVFLRKINRLSEEQARGIVALQSQTRRDIENIVLQGRYLDPDDLASCLERMFIEELARVSSWKEGTYQFKVDEKWPHPPSVRASVEGLLMEVARRSDEWGRLRQVLTDDHLILGLRDFPDLDEQLSDEERDLFGIVDGRRTLGEVVAASSLTEFETYESLHRMLESGWVEVVGRREVEIPSLPVAELEVADAPESTARAALGRVAERMVAPSPGRLREAGIIAVVAIGVVALAQLGHFLNQRVRIAPGDVFVAAQLRDVRHALELFHRQQGHYPRTLEELVEDGWVPASHLRVPGHQILYRPVPRSDVYQLRIDSER